MRQNWEKKLRVNNGRLLKIQKFTQISSDIFECEQVLWKPSYLRLQLKNSSFVLTFRLPAWQDLCKIKENRMWRQEKNFLILDHSKFDGLLWLIKISLNLKLKLMKGPWNLKGNHEARTKFGRNGWSISWWILKQLEGPWKGTSKCGRFEFFYDWSTEKI